MEFPVKVDLSESANHVVDNLAGPATKTIGETIDDLIFLCLGGIGHAADKRKLKYAYNLSLFEDGLRSKVEAIPPEKLIEPDTQKVLGALDDAKFCVEHEELRNMFENLIASSLSSDTASMVHPSFSGIVRRMSVLDAKTMSLFASRDSYPIAEYRVYLEGSGFLTSQSNVFLQDVDGATLEEKAASLQNLEGAGLVRISYDLVFTDEATYAPFYETEYFTALKKQTEFAEQLLNDVEQIPSELQSQFQALATKFHVKKIDFQKGMIKLTDLGSNFLQSCGYQVKRSKLF